MLSYQTVAQLRWSAVLAPLIGCAFPASMDHLFLPTCWSINAVGASEVSRRYLEGTMVLETTFRTPTGTAVLVDAMAMGRNERGHELGVNSPGIVLRSVSCQSGTVEIELEYAPRLEYGLIAPLLRPVQGGIYARGGAWATSLRPSVTSAS